MTEISGRVWMLALDGLFERSMLCAENKKIAGPRNEEYVVLNCIYFKTFTVMDQRKYSYNRMDAKIEAIAQSLGVDIPKAGQRRNGFSNSSYFNSAGGTSSSESGGYSSGVSYGSASIEDIE